MNVSQPVVGQGEKRRALGRDAMDEGKKYRGGLQADWDSLLENLQKALGLDVSQDEDFENSDD